MLSIFGKSTNLNSVLNVSTRSRTNATLPFGRYAICSTLYSPRRMGSGEASGIRLVPVPVVCVRIPSIAVVVPKVEVPLRPTIVAIIANLAVPLAVVARSSRVRLDI